MVKASEEVLRCAYPGCENKPRPVEAGPVAGEPHLALTAFRWR